MADWQITCINKTYRNDPHDRISRVGGPGWRKTVDEVITLIRRGDTFWVRVNGVRAEVIVATHNGREYIKTRADGLHPNNLLALPECT